MLHISMSAVTNRLLQQVSDNVRRYYEQYRYICLKESYLEKSEASEEHDERRRLYARLSDVEKAQAHLIIVSDEDTCPKSLLPPPIIH